MTDRSTYLCSLDPWLNQKPKARTKVSEPPRDALKNGQAKHTLKINLPDAASYLFEHASSMVLAHWARGTGAKTHGFENWR